MELTTLARRAALATLFALALATPSSAQTVVFDNGNPDLDDASVSDVAQPRFIAETFTFGATTTFDTVRWFGVYAFENTVVFPDAFTISFFDTMAGTPNALPRIGEVFAVGNPGRIDTGNNIGFIDVYRYEVTLSSPVTMGAGVYGISIVNDTTADLNDNWLWANSAFTGTYFSRTSPTGDFSPLSGSLAFQLISNPAVVPEPGTLALALPALALIGVAVVRRRKQGAAVL